MSIHRRIIAMSAAVALAAAVYTAAAGELSVIAVEPRSQKIQAALDAPIVVHFDLPVRRDTVTTQSFWAFGRWSGAIDGEFSFSNDDRTVTLTPSRTYSGGETVMVILAHNITAVSGETMRAGGYSWQFWARAKPAALVYRHLDTLNTRDDSGERSRAYGGIASDMNGDGWLDITIVCEDTADLRVFLNRADGTGNYHDFIQPTFPVNDRASPSEPADFNRDGVVDICVVNINTNSVSILLGNGDGTLGPQQQITVGSTPRGIAVLDVDGDGDIDIVNTNVNSSNMSVLLNDGNGVFGRPTFFEGGGSGEWALAAADMNNDGILDLVIGANAGRRMLVSLGNGDGTFTNVESQQSGGAVWMIVCGDVNGDGNVDVAGVNSRHNNGAILFGDGLGNLSSPRIYATDPFPLATDLGDLDGDGDLDWVTSSFSGDWFMFTNDGDGTFTFAEEFIAPQAASCALMLDIDNDGDLDLGLIDEIADVVVLMKSLDRGDVNCDGSVNAFDIEPFLVALFDPKDYPIQYPDCDIVLADINADGRINAFDIEPLLEILFP